VSTSVFKGALKGGKVSARFLSDFSNVDSDLLVISYAEMGGGNPQVDQRATAPGGFADVSVDAQRPGVLEVWVATGHAGDRGRLSVSSNGTAVDEEPIQGSVRWVYSVESA
jgi:hypothetical protein